MNPGSLTYSVVTPARNEEDNLPRLGRCLAGQKVLPRQWIIVDNGSTDDTAACARELAAQHPWIETIAIPGPMAPTRGGPVVRAFMAGLRQLRLSNDVVVKLDADLSFGGDHFGVLLQQFAEDPTLGIAGGLCWEKEAGEWRPQYTTRAHVRGAEKAYRQACLDEILPLEECMGWDGIDELRAAVRGWRTATIHELRVWHHRRIGAREPRLGLWVRQGEMAHYMWYRPSYLLMRALYRSRGDPRAIAMLAGYVAAIVRRRPRLADPDVREWLRREQGLRRLRLRMREALGR